MHDGAWELSSDAMIIPEGWYVVSPDFVDGDEEGK